ncbi:MAG TPA: aconitase family protein [candidate division Zixibacteria bacterium]|jgi:hypothetical protein
MRIPRKTELIRLQALYKTDARIAEALGGIPEYLVTYWRRKKKIPRHTSTKFTQQQIQELWERFGDDFRAGRELNISKAAFYTWRRKYGLVEKPSELRLEQLQLRLGVPPPPRDQSEIGPHAQTASAKIMRRSLDNRPDGSPAFDWIVRKRGDSDDAPVAVCPGPRFRWPSTEPTAADGDLAAAAHGEPLWCLPHAGAIDWQLVESRLVYPGQLVRGPQTLLSGLGGVGLLTFGEEQNGFPKHTIKIELTRRISGSVDVEDLFLTMLSHRWHEDWPGTIIEFWGGPIERLSLDRKVKLCHLTVRAGAAAAMCPFDDVIRRHYGRLLQGRFPQSHPDRAAVYDGEHFLEGRHVESSLGVLHEETRWTVARSAEESGEPGGVLIGPGALPYEIERAAELVDGRRIQPDQAGCLLVCPATPRVYQGAFRRGWAQKIIAAGGSVLDVALSRRLGVDDLLQLAATGTSSRRVYISSIPQTTTRSVGQLILCSVRTALRAGLGIG